MTIDSIRGIEIFDSRGVPTLEVHCTLDTGHKTIASVPSGAFAGKYEAVPVTDIAIAIRNIANVIAPNLKGYDPADQKNIDQLLITLDGTPNKQSLGANTILGVSMAVARAGAIANSKHLTTHLRDLFGATPQMPVKTSPMFNVINGGAHADNNLTFQEFMVVPLNPELSFAQKMLQGHKIFKVLKNRLDQMGKSTNVGDEGGFAPDLNSNDEAMEILVEAIQEAGFTPGSEVGIALDVAANGIEDLMIATYPRQPLDYYQAIVAGYPIISLEDPFKEDAWADWSALTQAVGNRVALVGDDLFGTNPARLKQGIASKSANAISIKPNQIGTVTETLETIKLALESGIEYQISHRAGETEDTFIADLAFACQARFIKAGAPNRGERIAKYNEMIRLELGI
jgi:enolase